MYFGHQPADERNQNDDRDASRRQDEPGPGRGVHQHSLGELRDQDGARVQDAAGGADHDAAAGEISVGKHRKIDDRLPGDQQPADRSRYPKESEYGHQADEAGIEPVSILAAVHHDLETTQPDRDQGEADIVDAAAAAVLFPGRVFDHD